MKYVTIIFCLLMSHLMMGQIVINELDCDTPGLDDEEFVELKSDTPYFNLDGYVVVFFNGSSAGNDAAYMTIDLDGYQTDVNGLLLIGSETVTPFPQLLISANTIQNGADAVAIYLGSDYDFPQGTVATQTNLIDALVYDTSDSDDTELMALLGVSEQINEGSSNNTNSIQRANDGSYFVASPTPRANNDGSGVIPNAITMSTSSDQYIEGETFDIVFTAQENVSEDYTFSFTLNNFGFNEDDFTGETTVTILSGQSEVTTSITLVDDSEDEGDEELVIKFVDLVEPFIAYNNFKLIRIVDNDFTVAAWGTPINPTYGLVESTQPDGYYDSLDMLSGDDLKQAIQDIIADPTSVRAQTYADVIDIIKEADQNPLNSNEVWLVYLEEGRPKLDFQETSDNTGKWNREHTYPRSRGGFDSIEGDETADGVEIFWTTNADSLRHANSDVHAIKAADAIENSTRGNQFYGEYTGPSGTLGSFRGDVARGIFYLAIRYNDLDVVDGYPDGMVGQFGDLQTLLQWHEDDPVDDFEMNHNNAVYNWQFNRNPFIDQPELVDYIWGDLAGETWEQPLGLHNFESSNLKIYPNPASDKIFFKGLEKPAMVSIYSVRGEKIMESEITSDKPLVFEGLPSGIYFAVISLDQGLITKKIILSQL